MRAHTAGRVYTLLPCVRKAQSCHDGLLSSFSKVLTHLLAKSLCETGATTYG